MRKYALSLLLIALVFSCRKPSELERAGKHYRVHQDFASLSRVVGLLAPGADTSEVIRLLGSSIDMGFDLRYLVDSSGQNRCPVGAVFHYDENGKVDQQWAGEICE